MLLKLSRQSQEITKEAILGRLIGAVGKAGLGAVGAGVKGVAKGTAGALKTRVGRGVLGTGAITGMMAAPGMVQGTGAMHGAVNPRGNPFRVTPVARMARYAK